MHYRRQAEFGCVWLHLINQFIFRHIAEHYIEKDGSDVDQTPKPQNNKRNIVKCRLGTSQDQGKSTYTPTHAFLLTFYLGDPCFPDYTYKTVIAGLKESGDIWTYNIENNRKRWEAKAEQEKNERQTWI